MPPGVPKSGCEIYDNPKTLPSNVPDVNKCARQNARWSTKLNV